MEQQKEYYAFISYKREDEKWAKWLQDKLEHYKFPTNLNGRTDLPKNIRPTFRDVTDLNPGLLAEEIDNALRNSEWLIVVCSPRSAKSPWVCKEAQTFINLGREDHIIPFVIEGNSFSNDAATECYPEALLNLTGSKELLAANINEMGRDAAAIKVVARMFNLRFDALWQRYEREQRIKRRRTIGSIIGGVSLLAIASAIFALAISKKNIQLEKANVLLDRTNKELIEANNTFSQLESDKKQYTYAGELRGNSCDELWVMRFAYHPHEPIVAFSDDWGFWLHYLNSNIEKLLPIDKEYGFGEVERLCFSPDGLELMAEGLFGIYIWNVEKCALLGHFWRDDKGMHNFETKFPDLNKDSLMEIRKSFFNSKIDYDYKDGRLAVCQKYGINNCCSTNMEMDKDSSLLIIPNPIYNEVLFVTHQRAAIYDDTKKEFVIFFKGADDFEYDDSGELLRVGKNIYSRTITIDTIQNLKYTTKPIADYPSTFKDRNNQYDEATNSSIESTDFSIIYRHKGTAKEIEVLKNYTTGNGQEYLNEPVFAGSKRIVAIVNQGKHRIFNTDSWTLIGTLKNYVWDGSMQNFGYESELSHAESFIATAEYINGKLLVVSSGGIVRIYNVNKPRLEAVVELPIKKSEYVKIGCLDKFYIAEEESRIYYSFEEQPFYYICELPLAYKVKFSRTSN